MDHAAFLVTLGVIATLVATTYGLLPERLDLSHVFAAYGAGNILGEIVAARRGVLGVERAMRRWAAAIGATALIWALGLLRGILCPRCSRVKFDAGAAR